MAIQDVEEPFDIVDLHARTATQVTRDDPEWLVIDRAIQATADRGIHDVAVRATGSAAFPGKGFGDIVVQGERCPV